MTEPSTNFTCKTCGALLTELAAKSQNGLVECPYCHNTWTIPKKETSPAALSFLRIAEHDLDTGKFDDAFTAYKKAAELDSKEPEAYFGMALAAFKVQYLKDLVNNRMQPICHEAAKEKFTDNPNYMRALLNATPEQRTEYEKKGKEIDYILAEFSRLEESGLNYDCFLCVKVSGENGPTEDSKDAGYIYDLLKNKGYKPFYSERELRNVTGADYEARILYALVKSECMLVICRNEEYLQTPWVKNEYTRFLKLVNDEEKESDSITLVFYEKPIERLPGRNGKLQGIDFSRREADGKLIDFVESHTPEAKAKREQEARRKAEQEQARAQREARFADQLEEQKKAQRELEERLQRLSESRGSGASGGFDMTPLLKRAFAFLSAEDFKNAEIYAEKVLDFVPENAEAYLVKFCCELGVKDRKDLAKRSDTGEFGGINFSNMMEYAGTALKEEIEGYLGSVKENEAKRIEKERLILFEKTCERMKTLDTPLSIEETLNILENLKDIAGAEEKIETCRRALSVADERIQSEEKLDAEKENVSKITSTNDERKKKAKKVKIISWILIVTGILIIFSGCSYFFPFVENYYLGFAYFPIGIAVALPGILLIIKTNNKEKDAKLYLAEACRKIETLKQEIEEQTQNLHSILQG